MSDSDILYPCFACFNVMILGTPRSFVFPWSFRSRFCWKQDSVQPVLKVFDEALGSERKSHVPIARAVQTE